MWVEASAAYCTALNHWQVETWTSREKRLKASIVVPYDDAAASVAEIERWADQPRRPYRDPESGCP